MKRFTDTDGVENNRNYFHIMNVLAVNDYCLFSSSLMYLEGRLHCSIINHDLLNSSDVIGVPNVPYDDVYICRLFWQISVFYTIIRIIQNKPTRRFILEGQIIENL
jgi:hypothetical protein